MTGRLALVLGLQTRSGRTACRGSGSIRFGLLDLLRLLLDFLTKFLLRMLCLALLLRLLRVLRSLPVIARVRLVCVHLR